LFAWPAAGDHPRSAAAHRHRPGLYAVGALLCVIDTTWSIRFIVLVQLNYAVAPRIGFLARL
jgi:hypothetical protein